MLKFLNEGDVIFIQGSGKKPYEVKKIGGVVSCDCLAWRNMGGGIDTRVCKHIKANVDPACLLSQAAATITASSSSALSTTTTTGAPAKTSGGAAIKPTAPPVLLAHPWDNDDDPTGWWMSEKKDGLRAWWTGEKFLSRLGNEIHAPEWFKKLLPKDTVLDGELWIARGQFQKTISVVRKFIPDENEWNDITYIVFDAPNFGGTFEERLKFLETKLPEYKPFHSLGFGHVAFLEQTKCLGKQHLSEMLKKVEAFGGEGVMLRQAGSKYESGRSNTCMKVKTFVDDEATVVGYTNGQGKHKGRIGALVVSWKNVEFEIGTGLSDAERKSPPAIGSRVTFKYTGLTDAGKPKFASYVCSRDYE